jgi:hypothetical protein
MLDPANIFRAYQRWMLTLTPIFPLSSVHWRYVVIIRLRYSSLTEAVGPVGERTQIRHTPLHTLK